MFPGTTMLITSFFPSLPHPPSFMSLLLTDFLPSSTEGKTRPHDKLNLTSLYFKPLWAFSLSPRFSQMSPILFLLSFLKKIIIIIKKNHSFGGTIKHLSGFLLSSHLHSSSSLRQPPAAFVPHNHRVRRTEGLPLTLNMLVACFVVLWNKMQLSSLFFW